MLRAVTISILAIGIVAGIVTVTICVWPWPGIGTPLVILPDGVEYDCGIVIEQQGVSHRFRIKNGGTGLLKIVKMITNCACIDAKIGKKELLPGEVTEVAFGYTANKRVTRATVTIETNDPSQQWISLTIFGAVRQNLQYYPGAITFWGHEVSPQEIHLVALHPVSDWRVECSKKWIEAKMVEKDGENKCVVSLDTDCPGGTWGESITVTAMCGDKTEAITIPVLLRGVHRLKN